MLTMLRLSVVFPVGVLLVRTMAWTSSGNSQSQLVQNLRKNGVIHSPRVFEAMLATDRALYCSTNSYMDSPQPIGYQATISAPHMVGPTGTVVGIDHIPELVEQSVHNVQSDNSTLLSSDRLTLIVGDGRRGYPDGAPYDAIHVGAAAVVVPQDLLHQLKPGGRMVVPVGENGRSQSLQQFDKMSDGTITRTTLMGVIYVPLTDRERQLRGDL
ncbi:l-isoaspartyl protein carboxyl methyltransferase, like isoform X2 [Cetorhinus maximus]